MGKASKWFKSLLGFKKSEPSHNPNPAQKPPPSKKRWSFTAKSHKEKDRHKSQNDAAPAGYDDDEEASRHARAVAAATAAVAEAAVAAAQAAAAVVKLTSGGAFDSITCASQNVAGYGSREERAAILIQSHFRAYLSREALRALKALVKLQALVRGQILRKHYVRKLREMEAIARAQARSRAVLISEIPHSSTKSSPSNHTGRASQEKVDHVMLARSTKHEQPVMFKRNGSRSSSNVTYEQEKSPLVHRSKGRRTGEGSWEQGSFSRFAPMDDERSDKILEVDTWKPHVTPKRRTIFHSPQPSHSSDQYSQSFSMLVHQRTGLSPSSGEVQSLSPLTLDIDGNVFSTAENSPQYYSASSMGGSSKRAPFTPTKSDGSRSCLSGYSDHPSYMAYTESSKAKVRSLSAPKQRPQYERSSSTNRYSVHGYGDSRPHTQKASTLHANLTNKAYPGSGHLDRFGMPVRGDFSGFSGGHLHRY